MRAAFLVNNRNKGRYVGRAVTGALSQTYPCEILISDYDSTDNSCEEIQKAIDKAPRGANHEVAFAHCDLGDSRPTMSSCNAHINWCVQRIKSPWVFQCSSDDYSLPRRVEVCMRKLEELQNNGMTTAGISTAMFMEQPDHPGDLRYRTGYPTEEGYVSGGIGIHKYAYGSTIWGYKRDWLLKVGLDVPCTLDVYLGYLASVSDGFYYINEPLHVHYYAEDLDNIGFQGKLRAAEKIGDKENQARLNELNRFQLFEAYYLAAAKQQTMFPLAKQEDRDGMVQMIMNQAVGWYHERKNLHNNRWTPGIL